MKNEKHVYIILYKRNGIHAEPQRFYITAEHKHDAIRRFVKQTQRNLRILSIRTEVRI